MPRTVSGGQHLITEVPGLTKCYKCRRTVLAAVVGGLERKIDTATLSQAGELAMLLEGRNTFELKNDFLMRRDQHKIRAGFPKAPVLAEHACKDVPDSYIEHAWTTAAMAQIILAVGGVIVSKQSADTAPPF